jgi:hypothetical protein
MKLGFLSTLTLIFITLKLTNVIAWSWWWVLGLLWIVTVALVFLWCVMIFLRVVIAVR